MASKRSVLLALTDSHHGFFKGAARYAREHGWHVVADNPVYDSSHSIASPCPLRTPSRCLGARRIRPLSPSVSGLAHGWWRLQ